MEFLDITIGDYEIELDAINSDTAYFEVNSPSYEYFSGRIDKWSADDIEITLDDHIQESVLSSSAASMKWTALKHSMLKELYKRVKK